MLCYRQTDNSFADFYRSSVVLCHVVIYLQYTSTGVYADFPITCVHNVNLYPMGNVFVNSTWGLGRCVELGNRMVLPVVFDLLRAKVLFSIVRFYFVEMLYLFQHHLCVSIDIVFSFKNFLRACDQQHTVVTLSTLSNVLQAS